MRNLEILVRARIKPPPQSEVDVERYLLEHLDSKCDVAKMALQERPQLDSADNWLRVTPGSQKRQIALFYSPRGSGKSQFVKWFVHQRRAKAMKCGRVIVRCCDVATQKNPQPSWIALVLQDCKKTSTTANR